MNLNYFYFFHEQLINIYKNNKPYINLLNASLILNELLALVSINTN